MLHEFFLVCYYLAPFWVPFFALAGILTWISDKTMDWDWPSRDRTSDYYPEQDFEKDEQRQNQRPAC